MLWAGRTIKMATRKRHTPEQVVRKLTQADRMLAEGIDIADACRELQVSEPTYYRWRNQFGGLKADDAKRLKDSGARKRDPETVVGGGGVGEGRAQGDRAGKAAISATTSTRTRAVFRHRAVDRERGDQLHGPEVGIYQIRDGKIVRSQMFHADSAGGAQPARRVRAQRNDLLADVDWVQAAAGLGVRGAQHQAEQIGRVGTRTRATSLVPVSACWASARRWLVYASRARTVWVWLHSRPHAPSGSVR
jgi:hypothetical protein